MMKTNSTESSSYSTRGVRATLVPQEEDEPPITTTTRANVLQVMELSEEGVVSVQHEEFFFKGELQPLEYRDKAFAIVFWVQAAALLVTAILMGGQPDPHNDSEAGSNGDSNSSNNGGNILVWLVGTCLSALAVMGVYLHLLMRHARNMVPISFFAAPLFLIGLAAAVYLDPESDGLSVVYGVLGAVLAVVSLCYYISLKRYMPFAVANLRTALAAIRANQGLLLVAWGNGMAAILLIIVWLFATLPHTMLKCPVKKDKETTITSPTMDFVMHNRILLFTGCFCSVSTGRIKSSRTFCTWSQLARSEHGGSTPTATAITAR